MTTLGDTNYYAVYESEAEVHAVEPDLQLLKELHPHGVAITAPGDEVGFVSRYFAPGYGVPEDPVTGSTHCALAPYWAERLGKTKLRARQLSRRGGDLFCEVREDRVLISGRAAKYFEGEINF
jgi:predicted PhzF superfamily epimerase YddE/YHI9